MTQALTTYYSGQQIWDVSEEVGSGEMIYLFGGKILIKIDLNSLSPSEDYSVK